MKITQNQMLYKNQKKCLAQLIQDIFRTQCKTSSWVFFLLGSISYFDSSIFYHIELLQCQWMFWVIDVSYHIWKKLIQVIILIILVTVRFIGLKNMPYRCKTDMFSCQHSKNTHVSLIFNTLVNDIIVC